MLKCCSVWTFIASLVVLLSYSFAQESASDQSFDNLFSMEPQQEAQPTTPPPAQPAPPAQILSPKDIPQGFGAQVQPPPAPAPEPEPVAPPPEPKVEPLPPPPVVEAPKIDPYPNYEVFLDSIELFARLLFPESQRLDSALRAVNEEPLQPKGQYEKQADYDSRVANFDKYKQQKLANVEREHNKKMDKSIGNLVSVMKMKRDIQPEWGSLLEQNADADEYQKRIEKFKEKISDMEIMIIRIDNLLLRLKLKQSDLDALTERNKLYMVRLERACDLMRDYILQDYAKVMSTDKQKFNMTLGTYDAEKEVFPLNINDISSQTVPFDFHGELKASTGLAQVIDGKTDDFTTSIDYINYPFTINGVKVYPGAKKAYIYFRDQEISHNGAFKSIDGYDRLEGYVDWAVRVDSLITGKLVPKYLDATYATKKVRVGPPFWTAARIIRAVAFGLSATSLGLGIWQNQKVDSQTKDANRLYRETNDAIAAGDFPLYNERSKKYTDTVNSLQTSQDMRLAFYSSSGALGFIGLLSFLF